MRVPLAPLLSIVLALAGGCTASPATTASVTDPSAQARVEADGAGPAPGEWFVDRAREAGIDVVHFNGMSGRFYQPEIMAPGVGLLDYDNDGDLDVYVVQGHALDARPPLIPPAAGQPLEDRLFRNDLVVQPDGSRVLHFTDVTATSGIRTRGYGMGVAAGDIDNDGWVDLYLPGFGRNQMFRNNGNGTFTDVTKASGTDDPRSWGVSASFFDYDRDGWLDLFVGNYLSYSVQTHVDCLGPTGAPDYCRPEVYRAEPNRLYRNTGRGRYEDVTIPAGVARPYGPALGSSTADFNGDGWIDLFVTNDQQENQLWINQRNGTFTDTALIAGAALGASGERKANMGVDAGDFDADGDEDLFVTELVAQGSTLFVNDGTGAFEDQSVRRGIHQASLPYTGFGTAWFDVDNDGWLDLLAVNGDVNRTVKSLANRDDPFPLGQRRQLFLNVNGRFEDVSARAGRTFALVEAGRGAAFGDVDNDGDTDVLVGNGAGPVRLLINDIGARHHWLGLRLVGGDPRRDMLGARVEIRRTDRPSLWRRARADGSYASANDPRVLAGLGDAALPVSLRVLWPDGRAETFEGVQPDRYTTLTQGTGRP